jgi:hypothetical protein
MGITIVRRSDSGDLAGEVQSIAVPYSGSFLSQSVTAVITKSGNLRLINWQVDASGQVTRIADSGTQAGQVSAISIAMGQWVGHQNLLHGHHNRPPGGVVSDVNRQPQADHAVKVC